MLYVLLFALTIISDQWLKHWTVTTLQLGESLPFIPHILQLRRLHNYGAAWSSLSGKTALLVAMTSVMLLVLTVLLFKKVVRHPLGVTACVLIIGGGIGNMIDRVALGYVVDMFDLLLFNYPVFNLADCFVVVGAILGSIYYLWLYEKYDAKKKEPQDGAEDSASDK